MTTLTIPVWLDCDPGNDDVFAILMAAYHPRFQLIAISTVHGNAPIENTTHNALYTLDVIHKNVPVYQGAAKPLVNPLKFAPEIHGVLGLGGVNIPVETTHHKLTDKLYLQAMHDAIEAHPGELCFAVTGTMTNLAQLLQAYPGIEQKIGYVAIMGGGVHRGNATKYAEFNFYADPHAANFCLQKLGSKAIIAPLDLTHQCNALAEVRERMVGDHTLIREWFYNVVMFYNELYIKNHGITAGPPVHDPVALYCLLPVIDNDFDTYGYKADRAKCLVTESGEHSGQLVMDDDANGSYIGTTIDAAKFWGELLDCLDRAEAAA
ncbi:nucleoside hydrolase [Kocuria palustris]|nr:nucleoside hydrolase [Kocuria palustris]